jgi:hypothetical protein
MRNAVKLPRFSSSTEPPEKRMHWVQVPFEFIMKLYEEPVLRVQRHHLRRAQNAKHLTNSDLPVHANYQAGRTPDGKLHLVDGYTRITIIKNGDKAAPECAWLGIVDVDTQADLDRLYDAVDSRFAVKRGRDAFEEGLRRSGLLGKMVSPVFTRAQAVSAVTAAAGHGDVRKAVWELRKGIKVLDQVHLGSGTNRLPAGALAALLLVAAQGAEPIKVQRLAVALERPDAVPEEERAAMAEELKAAAALKQRREDGSLSGKNVAPIMEMVLGLWSWLDADHGDTPPAPVSRAEFLASHANNHERGARALH